MATSEAELRTLMVAGLMGDAAAHRALLDRLSGHLRAYFKGRLARAAPAQIVREGVSSQYGCRYRYQNGPKSIAWC